MGVVEHRTREHVLDLIFLIGVALKGISGLLELAGSVILLATTPGQLLNVAQKLTAHELSEDPHDLLAHLILSGMKGLDAGTTTFFVVYLLLHGLVKIAIVIALFIGSRGVYPWVMVALTLLLGFQIYEMFVHPSVGLALLTVLDLIVLALTWHEWRHGKPLRETWRSTTDWVLHR